MKKKILLSFTAILLLFFLSGCSLKDFFGFFKKENMPRQNTDSVEYSKIDLEDFKKNSGLADNEQVSYSENQISEESSDTFSESESSQDSGSVSAGRNKNGNQAASSGYSPKTSSAQKSTAYSAEEIIKTRDRARVSYVRSLQHALKNYYDNNSNYPPTFNFGERLSDSGGRSYLSETSVNIFSGNGDSEEDSDFSYQSLQDGQSYNLIFYLEGGTDNISAGANVVSPDNIIGGENDEEWLEDDLLDYFFDIDLEIEDDADLEEGSGEEGDDNDETAGDNSTIQEEAESGDLSENEAENEAETSDQDQSGGEAIPEFQTDYQNYYQVYDQGLIDIDTTNTEVKLIQGENNY